MIPSDKCTWSSMLSLPPSCNWKGGWRDLGDLPAREVKRDPYQAHPELLTYFEGCMATFTVFLVFPLMKIYCMVDVLGDVL